nr:hypothetical protein [Anaerolineae bacterium]
MDNQPVSRLDLPFENLVLTGFLGVGKSSLGQHIAQKLSIDMMDIDEEIELREVMSIARLRELYGDTRLRAIEHELCRHAALMRKSVIVVPGAALLDERNYRILNDTGKIVVLSCDLGEALRRMHLASEQHFRDETIRRRMLSRLRREYEVVNDTRLLQIDTTPLTIEEEADLIIRYWFNGEAESPPFRYGPPERMTPPERVITGVSTRTRPG